MNAEEEQRVLDQLERQFEQDPEVVAVLRRLDGRDRSWRFRLAVSAMVGGLVAMTILFTISVVAGFACFVVATLGALMAGPELHAMLEAGSRKIQRLLPDPDDSSETG